MAAPPVAYTNPIANQRADTQIIKHTDGYYYVVMITWPPGQGCR